MKILQKTGFTFNPGQRKLDFSGVSGFDIRGLFAVLNAASAEALYVPGADGLGYSSLAGSVVTLAVDTTAMNAADPLVVLYDDGTAPASASAQASANALLTGILAAFPALVNGRLPVDPSGVTAPISATQLPLPAGAATKAGQDAAATVLSSILAAIQAQIDLETSIWTDGTAFYVRREQVAEGSGAIAIVYTDPTGAVVTPPSGIRPVASDNAISLLSTFFDVKTAGAGISVGDVVGRIVAVNKATNPPTASSAIWLNMSTGAAITAPASSAIVEQSQNVVMASPQLPATLGAKSAASSLSVTLSPDGQFVSSAGAPTDTAYGGSGSASQIAVMKGVYALLSGNLKAGALVQYNASLPAFTNGGFGYAQSDANGRLLISSIAGALPAGTNVLGGVTQSGGPWSISGTVAQGAAGASPWLVTWGAGLSVNVGANAPNTTIAGNLAAAGDAVTIAVGGMNTAAIQLTYPGGAAGSVSFLGSVDGGVSYFAINALSLAATGGAPASGATASGAWEVSTGALSHVRVSVAAAVTSGPVAAYLAATNGIKSVRATTPAGTALNTADVVPAAADNSYGPATSATNALAANAKRTSVYVRNDNSFPIYINFRSAAVVPASASTAPAAGNITIAPASDFKPPPGMCPKTAMSIIAGTAGGVVTIMEGTSP